MSRFSTDILERALAQVRNEAAKEQPKPSSSAAELTAALCRRFEGFSSHPYICPAGVPTIGYGATHYLDGRPVTMKDSPIGREAAERLLVRMIENTYMPPTIRLCPGADTPGRLAALTDFAFNCGVGALQASTLRRLVNAGNWGLVPDELRKWVNGGGRRLPGLVARREAEIELL